MKLLLASVLLLGLACKPPQIQYVEVPKIVTVPCPEPPVLAEPDYPAFHLKPKPPIPHCLPGEEEACRTQYRAEFLAWEVEVAKAYVVSFAQALGEVKELRRLLDGYRSTTPARKP